MSRDEVLKLAREAGFNVDEDNRINDGIETAADFSHELKSFHAATRAAYREELLAVAGAPVRQGPFGSLYTGSQMAAAVLKERERILNLPTIKGNLFAERNIKEQP